MRNLVAVFAALISLSLNSFANGDAQDSQDPVAAEQMFFQIKTDALGSPDINAVWNPALETVTLRATLLYTGSTKDLGQIPFSAKDAKGVEFQLRNSPAETLSCSEVVSAAFEYQPEMPEYLLYVTLKGPKCHELTGYLKTSDIRLRLLEIPLPEEAKDLSLDILNTAKIFN